MHIQIFMHLENRSSFFESCYDFIEFILLLFIFPTEGSCSTLNTYIEQDGAEGHQLNDSVLSGFSRA